MAEERRRKRFDHEARQLQNMVAVGEVGPDYARIWIRSDQPGEVTVTHRESGRSRPENESVATIEDETADYTETVLINALRPMTRYNFRVVRPHDLKLLGTGTFSTSPERPADTPEKVTIGLMSCHQPFNEDSFDLEPRRRRLLKVTRKILKDNDVKFLLLAGDQIYSDVPKNRSLFEEHYTKNWNHPMGPGILDWNAESVRTAFQERYRIFWNLREIKQFYASYPCYPILDDHEIKDDWGADEAHASRAYQNIKKGALQAYFDYQGSRVMERKARLPSSFHYSFDYGIIGVFVMDIRSQRKVGKAGDPNQLYSDAQMADFQAFLKRSGDKHVLLIMSSVPLFHLPEWLTNIGNRLLGKHVDFADHWSHGPNRSERDRLLRVIYDHQLKNPRQRVIIVSGDVHIGCAFAIEWKGRKPKPTLYQFTSSAISNRTKTFTAEWSKAGPEHAFSIDCGDGLKARTRLLESEGQGMNPFGGLNLGIIEVLRERDKDESSVRLRLVGYTEERNGDYRDFFVSKKL